MSDDRLDRRALLEQGAAGSLALWFAKTVLSPSNAWAAANDAVPFQNGFVAAEAKRLAAQPFSKPSMELPEPFNKLGYDQYRDIRFRSEKSFWRGENLDFEIQPFAMGWLYDTPIELWVVEKGNAKRLVADGGLFSLGPLIGPGPDAAPFGFSGFRIHAPINRSDYYDEFTVFQGASYLRAVGRDEGYGASARGLALNTGRPGGEEFPFFRSFWLEKPDPVATEIVVHALLDSPSTTGAYRFAIVPGQSTTMQIDATLFPRKELPQVGIGALTSMFFLGTANVRRSNDFRPTVHDSEGLAMMNGRGERLWRPLCNPRTLQVSAFSDRNPKGFGLCQRDRSFQNYQDLEARYERRPSVWVEPKSLWGEGFVELIEIPVEDEIHDNIVAYWKPAKPLPADQPFSFSYSLTWGSDVPLAWSAARVNKTRVGRSRIPDATLFVVDYEGPAVRDARDLPVANITASGGQVANVSVQRNPDISGVRVSFDLKPQDAELIELRMVLKGGDQVMSETWLYRWTKP